MEYDVLQYFGDLGGLLEIVLLAGGLVNLSLVPRLANAQLVKKIYRMQDYAPLFSQKFNEYLSQQDHLAGGKPGGRHEPPPRRRKGEEEAEGEYS